MNAASIPPIELWWPHLDIEFKHEIIRNPDAPLSRGALAQVYRLSNGELATSPVYLSASDKDFIRTQTELVD